MEVVITTGACKLSKAPVKLSSPTYQHPTFYRLQAVLSPNQRYQSSEGRTERKKTTILTYKPPRDAHCLFIHAFVLNITQEVAYRFEPNFQGLQNMNRGQNA